MVVHDAGGCHSDRDTVSSHFCQGSFNQRLRGDCRSLKDLLSALGSIGVDPRLLQNAVLGTEGPGMFNVTSPQEGGYDDEYRPPDRKYHRICPDRQDELELGPVNAKARCYKDIHPANQRDDAEEWVEPHAIGTIQVGLPAA